MVPVVLKIKVLSDEHGNVDDDDIGADDAFDHLVGVEGSVVVPALLVRLKFSLERKLEDWRDDDVDENEDDVCESSLQCIADQRQW